MAPSPSSDALCARTDPDEIRLVQMLFFGETKEAQAAAKVICNSPCPLRTECLHGSLERREPYGVWGGLSAKERKALLKARKVSQ